MSRLGPDSAAGRREDLFSVIDAAGELLDVPIVLEDTEFRVLAWSKGQHTADDERVSGILERQAQPWLVEVLRSRGDIARLIASPDPVFLDPASDRAKPRMACRVQHDGPHLGYLWASTRTPFDPQRAAHFRAAAQTIAVRMSRDGQGTTEQDDLKALLFGTPDAEQAAARLGLSAAKVTVLAAAQSRPAHETVPSDMLRLYLTTAHPRALVVRHDRVTYAVLPWPTSTDDADAKARSAAIARDLWDRAALRERVVLAVSTTVTQPGRIPSARSHADRITALQQQYPTAPRVAAFEDVQLLYALSRLRGALRQDGESLGGAVSALEHHDRHQHTQLLATLRCYLDHFGDTNAAAAQLHLHPNTFRYRLQRIREVSGFDPRDAQTRFLTELHLRLRDLEPPD
ncbi:helix-turn-helix domain-containing protein [Streptomyces roseirectus]|uniref:Helix-turn-helix domain-containing protein n=1 Tax=Streptomyces roseirectus TaxID=2768066 RepID=A0A7H0I613_9ACTN|nr:helix-turn-helix domain-containing protein [Streptomyces roseirectus]QNP68229.1 helix-turn-helix domain-containing protein [Streptomyces roseirectus]